MSNQPTETKNEEKPQVSFTDGVLQFLSTSQSTFINQQFNQAIWKCYSHYFTQFDEVTKGKRPTAPVEVQNFFADDKDQPKVLSFQNKKDIEMHCLITLKDFTQNEFKEEETKFNLCRKECEIASAESGRIISFVKNERCFKNCRIDFDRTTKEKVIQVFTRFLPDLQKLSKVNTRRDEENKIKEITRTYIANHQNEEK